MGTTEKSFAYGHPNLFTPALRTNFEKKTHRYSEAKASIRRG